MDFRYGILSTSSIAPRFINALRESGRGEAVAVASRSLEKAQAKAAEWGIPKAYGSYEALLEDEDINVAYVAMINAQHYKYAKLALEKGKHVICEKPFTLDHRQAQELFALAKSKHLFIAEAQKAVFLPAMIELKRMIADGRLGKIHFCDFTASCDPVYNEWLHKKEAGGGALAGSASYSIHLAKFLFDKEIVDFSGLCTKGSSEVDEQCVVNLNLGGDLLMVSKISTNVKGVDRALIFGDKGWAEIADFWKARKAFVHLRTGEEIVIEHPCKYELVYEINHFHDCMEAGLPESPVMSEAMTVSSLKVLDSLRNSWM